MIGKDGEVVGSKKSIFVALILAIIVVHIPKYFSSPSNPIDWLLLCAFLSCVLMTFFPFLLARMIPQAAEFDTQWLPDSLSQWAWFLVMAVAVLVSNRYTSWLMNILGFKFISHSLLYGAVTPTKVILLGVVSVLLYPIAEEIFWRGYLLEQLRKLTHPVIALLIQSILFSFVHLFLIGVIHSIAAFWSGIILGWWRITFRSLVPLILVHTIINAFASIPDLKILYDFTPMLAKPKIQQISLLTEEPIPKAVPLLIGFLSDTDEDVRAYATSRLLTYHRKDLEPCLKQALLSKDHKILDGVLFIIEVGHCSSLKKEVREIVWSVDDLKLQIYATSVLMTLEDVEGLQQIAKSHPEEKVRQVAEHLLKK